MSKENSSLNLKEKKLAIINNLKKGFEVTRSLVYVFHIFYYKCITYYLCTKHYSLFVFLRHTYISHNESQNNAFSASTL